ncbi:MAG: hypothetical protein HQK78_17745 [Desulfobacterales bacterium]|nr:hypothetical protein [Desulfobacterales bacterium]
MEMHERLNWMILDALSEETKNPIKKIYYKYKMEEIENMKDENTTQLTLRLPKELHREFKSFCSLNGQSMGDVIMEVIKKYVEEQKVIKKNE